MILGAGNNSIIGAGTDGGEAIFKMLRQGKDGGLAGNSGNGFVNIAVN